MYWALHEDTYDMQYLNICADILKKAKSEENLVDDRTGVGCYSDFARYITHDLRNGFPLLLCKFTSFKAMATEMLAFSRGVTNNNWLVERGCNIWTPWAREDGELGPIYGSQLRNFNGQGFDQLKFVVDTLKTNPSSRRIQFTYYNPLVLPDESLDHNTNINNGKAVLPPCHVLYNFNVEELNGEKYLNGSLTQRSADVPLGAPFNTAQLALWVHVLAHHTGLKVGKINHLMIDAHIYSNQVETMSECIKNVYKEPAKVFDGSYPELIIHADKDLPIDEYEIDNFEIINYNPMGKYKFDISV